MQQCEGLQLDSLPRINRLGSVVSNYSFHLNEC